MTLSQKQMKRIALLILIIFLFSLLFSITYLAKESSHKCVGDHCPICMQMREVQKTISIIGAAAFFVFLANYAASVSLFGVFHFFNHIISATLVSQNIRMNN